MGEKGWFDVVPVVLIEKMVKKLEITRWVCSGSELMLRDGVVGVEQQEWEFVSIYN